MARRSLRRERQQKSSFEKIGMDPMNLEKGSHDSLYSTQDGTTAVGEPISALRVAQGDKLGMNPVLRNRGESISAAFRRVQRECAGSVRPYVICLE